MELELGVGAAVYGGAFVRLVCWTSDRGGYQLWRGILWPQVGARGRYCWRRIGRGEEKNPKNVEPRKLDVLVV